MEVPQNPAGWLQCILLAPPPPCWQVGHGSTLKTQFTSNKGGLCRFRSFFLTFGFNQLALLVISKSHQINIIWTNNKSASTWIHLINFQQCGVSKCGPAGDLSDGLCWDQLAGIFFTWKGRQRFVPNTSHKCLKHSAVFTRGAQLFSFNLLINLSDRLYDHLKITTGMYIKQTSHMTWWPCCVFTSCRQES